MGCHQSPPSDSTVANPPESAGRVAGKRLGRELRYDGEEIERRRAPGARRLVETRPGTGVRRDEQRPRELGGEYRQRRSADDRRVMRDGANGARMRALTGVAVAAERQWN